MMAAVLQTFLASMSGSIAALDDALARQDGAAAVSIAHRIKGAGRISGAAAMADQAMLLEGQARQGDWPVSRATGERVHQQWAVFQAHPRVRQLLALAPPAASNG